MSNPKRNEDDQPEKDDLDQKIKKWLKKEKKFFKEDVDTEGFLNEIETEWTRIEELQEDPHQLGHYFAARYYKVLERTLRARFGRYLKNKVDVLEILAEVFVDLLKNEARTLRKLNREKGSARRYLSTIASGVGKKEVVKRIIHGKGEYEVHFEFYDLEEIATKSKKELVQNIRMDVRDALTRLKEDREEEYSILYLFYEEGKTTKQISEELEKPEGTIKSKLRQGKSRIAYYLKSYEPGGDLDDQESQENSEGQQDSEGTDEQDSEGTGEQEEQGDK